MYAHVCAHTRIFDFFDNSPTILHYNARLQALTPGGRILKIGIFDHHSTTVRPPTHNDFVFISTLPTPWQPSIYNTARMIVIFEQ